MGKYEAIAEVLRQEINAHKYEYGSRFPSEMDLMDRFGVNPKTINKAVSLLVAEGLLKRGIRGSGTHVRSYDAFPRFRIAYVGMFYHPYYVRILHGIQRAALSENCLVDVVSTPAELQGITLEKIRNSDIKGIITHGCGPISDARIPVLNLEEESENVRFPDYVTCNSYQGGYEMMKQLIERGHREIVILTYISDTRARIEGFLDAMREAGISDPEKRVYTSIQTTKYDMGELYEAMKADHPGFTAVASTSDNNIFHFVSLLEKNRIPWRGKLALTGFGNVSGISNLLPIASVDQHPYHIGVRAFQAIMRKIADPKLVVQEQINIELVGLENIPVLNRHKKRGKTRR